MIPKYVTWWHRDHPERELLWIIQEAAAEAKEFGYYDEVEFNEDVFLRELRKLGYDVVAVTG